MEAVHTIIHLPNLVNLYDLSPIISWKMYPEFLRILLCLSSMACKRTLAPFHRKVGHCVRVVGFIRYDLGMTLAVTDALTNEHAWASDYGRILPGTRCPLY